MTSFNELFSWRALCFVMIVKENVTHQLQRRQNIVVHERINHEDQLLHKFCPKLRAHIFLLAGRKTRVISCFVANIALIFWSWLFIGHLWSASLVISRCRCVQSGAARGAAQQLDYLRWPRVMQSLGCHLAICLGPQPEPSFLRPPNRENSCWSRLRTFCSGFWKRFEECFCEKKPKENSTHLERSISLAQWSYANHLCRVD